MPGKKKQIKNSIESSGCTSSQIGILTPDECVIFAISHQNSGNSVSRRPHTTRTEHPAVSEIDFTVSYFLVLLVILARGIRRRIFRSDP